MFHADTWEELHAGERNGFLLRFAALAFGFAVGFQFCDNRGELSLDGVNNSAEFVERFVTSKVGHQIPFTASSPRSRSCHVGA